MEKFSSRLFYIFHIVALVVLLILACLTVWYASRQHDPNDEITFDDVDHEKQACSPRFFDSDSFVCLCNATYCDTIDKMKKPPENTILVYTTSKVGHRFYQTQLPFSEKSFQCSILSMDAEMSICINSKHEKQTIVGFGGSFTDATGINILSLSQPTQQKLKEAYFSENGLEYNIFRVPIGGSDFSNRPYSYDDNSPGDFQFSNFTLQPEDFLYKIPLIKEASKMSQYPIKLVATSWSPPSWMKSNHHLNGFGWLKGKVGGEYYDLLAKYYIRFLREYHNNGIDFWGLTTQNEPYTGFIPFYKFNTLGFTPDMLRNFVKKNLGPQLKASEFNSTKLFIYDNDRTEILLYVITFMNDDDARQYADGIAVHWYFDTREPPSLLDIIHNAYPEIPMLMTESCIIDTFSNNGKPVELGSWQRADITAKFIIENLQHWITGWIDWNMALDLQGGPNWSKNFVDAPIIVNNETDEFYKQPLYYIIGHFSKFIAPGSVVLDTKESWFEQGISSIAFKTPDSLIVLVVRNSSDKHVLVKVKDLHGGVFHAKIPANSVQTYMWAHV